VTPAESRRSDGRPCCRAGCRVRRGRGTWRAEHRLQPELDADFPAFLVLLGLIDELQQAFDLVRSRRPAVGFRGKARQDFMCRLARLQAVLVRHDPTMRWRPRIHRTFDLNPFDHQRAFGFLFVLLVSVFAFVEEHRSETMLAFLYVEVDFKGLCLLLGFALGLKSFFFLAVH